MRDGTLSSIICPTHIRHRLLRCAVLSSTNSLPLTRPTLHPHPHEFRKPCNADRTAIAARQNPKNKTRVGGHLTNPAWYLRSWFLNRRPKLQFLGRVIRLNQIGIELEGDGKHVEMMEKEWDMTQCNPVASPYVKPVATGTGAQVEAKYLSSADATPTD